MRFRFDLSAKLAVILLLWVCAFVMPWIIQAILVVLAVAARFSFPAYRPQSSRSARAFSRFMVYSAAGALLILAVNSWLMTGGTRWEIVSGLAFHEEGLLFGVRTLCRLLLLSFSILVFFVSTPLPLLIRYLQEKGVSQTITMTLLLTLHFLDQLPARIHQIFLAQQARGAPVDANLLSRFKALLTILSPLVFSSIVESLERGTALELRGFLRHAPATQGAPESGELNLLTLGLIATSIVIIILSIAEWQLP